jgi:hypothetical protein
MASSYLTVKVPCPITKATLQEYVAEYNQVIVVNREINDALDTIRKRVVSYAHEGKLLAQFYFPESLIGKLVPYIEQMLPGCTTDVSYPTDELCCSDVVNGEKLVKRGLYDRTTRCLSVTWA